MAFSWKKFLLCTACKLVRDAVQLCVLGRVGADGSGRAARVAVAAVEAGAVALIPEAREIHLRLVPRASAIEAHGAGGERHAEDPADGLEVLVDEVVPFVVETGLAIP